jgi:CheY-like chemotaxis protein
VKLPLTHAPEPPQPVAPDAETALHPHEVKVLVVDDNIDQVTMLTSMLEHVGYSVQSAYTGPDGLKVAQDWLPDIALLDIGLPGLDGYEVARRLRSDPHTKTTQLIALTGYARDTDISLAAEAGFDTHLTKPLDFSALKKLMPLHHRPDQTQS